jgi:hypothetical protein
VTGATPHDPFWLVLGQSHTDGWHATAGGKDLGPPVLVDGYANGWRIDPAGAEMAVELSFTPQRRVDLSLTISGFSALLCLLLALRRPRPLPLPNRDEEPAPLSTFLTVRYDGTLPSRRAALIVGGLLGLAAAVLVHPVLGVGLAALCYRGVRDDRTRRWIVFGAPAAMVAAGAYVVVWQLRYAAGPGLEWPHEFWRANPLGWTAVLLLIADVVINRVWTVDQAPSGGRRRWRLRSD